MPRSDQFSSGSSNPAKYFLEWKSDEKCFSFYNKEKAENQLVKLPFKFMLLRQAHAVGGWDDKHGSGIYSNEVLKISEQPLTVKSFKGGVIAAGLYKDIKTQIADAGGHYMKSVYVMTEKEEIVNIQLKGIAGYAWGEFIKANEKKSLTEWISVAEARDDKKGAVKFSVPVFSLSGEISKDQGIKGDELYDIVDAHLTKKDAAPAPQIASVEQVESEDDSDLPF